MSTELKQIIFDLRKRVDILTKELKVLRSSLSKMNNTRRNPYKWNRYYNHDKQEKITENQTKPHEKKVIKENCQSNLKNAKVVQRKSKFQDKIHESFKSKKPEPMEIEKILNEKSCKSTKLEPMEVDKSLNQKSFKSYRPKTTMFDESPILDNRIEKSKSNKKLLKPTLEKKTCQQQVISILKNEKPKTNQSSNCVKPEVQSTRQQATEPKFEAKTESFDRKLIEKSKRNPENTSKIFLDRKNDLLSFERHDKQTGKKLMGFIDLGVSNNYIAKDKVKHGCHIELPSPIQVKAKNGKINVTHYVNVNLFTHCLKFLIIEDLGEFDLSLGFDGLRQMNAKIDLMSFELIYTDRNKIEDNFS